MSARPGSRRGERAKPPRAQGSAGASGKGRTASSRPTQRKSAPDDGSSSPAPWGERWIEAFSTMPGASPGRIERGLGYAAEGHIRQARISLGKITAQVQGSRPKPYQVSVTVTPFDDATWEKAIKAIRRREALSSAIQSGRIPLQIDRIFRALGVSLLPSRETDLHARCSCPDWANSCKHVAALHHALADALARDPLLLFELRGRPRDQVMRELRRARSPGPKRARPRRTRRGSVRRVAGSQVASSSSSSSGLLEGDYERRSGELAAMRFRFEPSESDGSILLPLGQPPSWSRPREPIDSWLKPTYQAASVLARAIALSESEAPKAAQPEPDRKPRPKII